MAQKLNGWCWSLRLAGSLAIGSVCAFSWDSTFAQQIIPDRTLPNNSTVKLEGDIRKIEGGTPAGSNLFHSFREFSVPTGSTAFFNNTSDIQNIISRVTGGSVSNIDGLIRANGANLFLINPNGIIFGPNAQLNIGGSFIASTASSLKFADGKEFSAKAPQNTPLLTVSVPIGLQFGQTPGEIRNQSRVSLIDPNTGNPVLDNEGMPLPGGLQVAPGKILALVGGSVNFPGGVLTAPGGRIELGSVAGVGEVSLNQTDNAWVLGYDRINTFGNIRLEDKAFVNASGPGGGDIQIRGNQLDMTQGARIYADTEGTEAGGEVLVHTTEAINLSEISQITANVTPTKTGTGGNVTITTQRLSLQEGAQISTGTYGSGRGGDLSVNASDFVEMRGIGILNGEPMSYSGLVSQTEGAGDAGNLTITTRRLNVYNGAQVSASSFSTGKAGHLTVNASDVELIGTTADDASYVKVVGTTANLQYPSGLFTQTQGTGDAGDLTITTRRLSVRDGAQVSAASRSTGKAGNLTVDASDVELSGTDGEYSSGLLVRSLGSGDAGKLEVQARSIKLDDQGKISAETKSGQGGDIDLQVEDFLLMRGGSQISTTAGSNGDGGNININTKFLASVPSEDSDITANANEGRGGFIKITAQGLFGIERREQLTSLSDITAISQQNPKLNGQVIINSPDVDLSRGFINLPTQPLDTKLAQGCNSPNYAQSSFIITGRGGLPPSPFDILTPDAIQVDWVTLNPNIDNRKTSSVSTNPPQPTPERIVEATGWVINAKGKVVFTADTPSVTPHSSWQKSPDCSSVYSTQ
ncbi:MAG: S-layer family protein [Iphinoe sp. HA4291-MV1]|jgi:filamentous hemagglutinin family protein|nr:S-layer family protein [Iphinoe sp. HA4291-MV1]